MANKKEIITWLAESIKKHKEGLLESEIRQKAENLLIVISELFSAGLIKIVAEACGSERLKKTFERALRGNSSLAFRLIKLTIDMSFNESFPTEEVLNLGREIEKNHFAMDILRALVYNHFYLFRVPYSTKQKICRKLDIELGKDSMLPA